MIANIGQHLATAQISLLAASVSPSEAVLKKSLQTLGRARQALFTPAGAGKGIEMVLSNMNRYSSSQLMVLTFCFALLIPAGASRAVDRKENAQAKLKTLQQTDSPKKKSKGLEKKEASKAEQGKAATEAYLKKVWVELQDAVAAGKMTKEQAIAKMAAIKKAKLGGK